MYAAGEGAVTASKRLLRSRSQCAKGWRGSGGVLDGGGDLDPGNRAVERRALVGGRGVVAGQGLLRAHSERPQRGRPYRAVRGEGDHAGLALDREHGVGGDGELEPVGEGGRRFSGQDERGVDVGADGDIAALGDEGQHGRLGHHGEHVGDGQCRHAGGGDLARRV